MVALWIRFIILKSVKHTSSIASNMARREFKPVLLVDSVHFFKAGSGRQAQIRCMVIAARRYVPGRHAFSSFAQGLVSRVIAKSLV